MPSVRGDDACMRIVLAPDKFKGSLTAERAAEAMAQGATRAVGVAELRLDLVPIADGGEGTTDALVAATGGKCFEVIVAGPLGTPVKAVHALLGDSSTAVLEMASASGLVLVASDQRDPLRASTRGTGELLLAACQPGVQRVILGIGGSATNDGGAGLAQSLGYRLLDEQGRELPPGGAALSRLARIDASNRETRLDSIDVLVACDVDNPLCGPKGASAIYGPQKGATPEMIEQLDQALGHFARVIERDLGLSVREIPGAGAAGGLGAGLVAFARGRLQPGIDLVLDAVKLRDRLQGADLCLTGEGSLDASSAHGKAVAGVARLAHELGCPCLAIAGSIHPDARTMLELGVDAYFSICRAPMKLEAAIAEAEALLADATEQAVRAFQAGRSR